MRTFKQQVQQEQEQTTLSYGPRPLPTDQPCAIYARQSTAKQVLDNPESARMQTTDQLNKAVRLGWTDDIIFLYVENEQADGTIKSASGTLRIDQREGLSALMERIYKDEIKAILVYSESRLFRDEWQIQVDTFIQACYQHDVRIVTSTYQYDFRRNPYDMDTFRMQSRIAADFIKNHVKGLLLPAKRAAAARGQADGRKVSIGYIVDRRRHLDNGNDNPNYKRFIPYQPHAEIVRRLFKRFKELNGNLGRLWREVSMGPYVFPFFEDPTHARYVRLSKNAKGYTLSKEGLGQLLTNVVYIGYWYYRDEHGNQQVRKDNHEPVVNEEDFWFAFNKLSAYTLDGERNMRDTNQHVKPRTERPDALLQDVIMSTNGRAVYVLATNPPQYAITDKNHNKGDHWKVSIRVAELDTVFLDRLFTVLNDIDHGLTIGDRLKEVQAEKAQALVSVDEQIAEANRKIARAERSKQIAVDEDSPEDERQAIRELKGLRATLAELESKKSQAQADEKDIEECRGLLVVCVRDGWDSLPFEKKRRFIGLITQSITISEASTHFMKLEITWTGEHGCVDTGYIWRTQSGGGEYSEEENAVIRDLYPVADRRDILERLPHRNWNGILNQARKLGLSRNRSCGNSCPLHADVSYQDNEIMQQLGVEYDEKWPDKRVFWLSPSNDNSGTPS